MPIKSRTDLVLLDVLPHSADRAGRLRRVLHRSVHPGWGDMPASAGDYPWTSSPCNRKGASLPLQYAVTSLIPAHLVRFQALLTATFAMVAFS